MTKEELKSQLSEYASRNSETIAQIIMRDMIDHPLLYQEDIKQLPEDEK